MNLPLKDKTICGKPW